MNLNRRKFLQGAGTLALGSIAFSGKAGSLFNLVAPQPQHPVGLQLFTFFGVIDEDVKGTLTSIAAIGYKEMESAFSKKGGYYGLTPKEFKSLVNDLGMSWTSHHVLGAPFKLPKGYKMPVGADGKPMVLPPMKNLRENMQQLVDEVAEGGVKYLVCANSPTGTLDEIKSTIEVLNKTGEAAKKVGIQFAYHNHDMEFHDVEGKVPYHLLLSETDSENVKMELDLAWAVKGGQDPVELFKAHPGRFPLWHVKDLDAERKTILPVGSGTIDFKRIFEHQADAGMKHFFVEHDEPKDPYTSIESSYKYITQTLKA
ncbi:sugar phosphate isomerase/epimerase family protein [Mucilaginibacter sp. X4EP1]|uniref:sugar phosphate isomerase/epimerase family protein n=1 Tax=Mucilaginibacter sp. X4EP1 TaxID=2723092 RepID=UPI002166D628|nr:sugar phosphate isomerase/epimerase [Mucilaginibacter sp. X4EP1]MCS3813220.1 sugar phosphate isomerase/epimerase [Mucilaginibacter sp. X4EP1]